MDAWTKFAEALFRLNGMMIAAGEDITAPLGQSSARWQVLGGLGYGPRTVADIARGIGHARQSVQRVADVLVAEGLVAQKPKPGDRRTSLLELTPEGMAVLTAIFGRQQEWSNRVTRTLAADQLESLAAQLQSIGDLVAADAEAQAQGRAPPD
jgi:DNA-binding MarR family transcriptional regulator